MSTRRTGRERHSRLTSAWPDTVAAQAGLTGARLWDAWETLLGRFPWQWFITLTFDPKRVFPVSRAVVEREATWWSNLVSKTLRLPVGWVCAPERGRGGLWHGHVVMLAKTPRWSPEAALPAWRERSGRIDARRVTNQAGMALYLTKAAAAQGTIVLSDTLLRYRHLAGGKVVVPLCPDESSTVLRQGGPEARATDDTEDAPGQSFFDGGPDASGYRQQS